MAPEPIFQPGPVDTPFVYEVSGTGTVTPRACQAVYDGSGAGGDYIPAVIFKSQAGHVIARAILQSTVTAGDDAEVSWFPGVKAAPASVTPTAGVAYSRGWFNHPFNGHPAVAITGGVPKRVPFSHIDADPSGAITWTTTTNTNDTAVLHSQGIYTVHGNMQLNIAGPGDALLILVPGAVEQLSGLFWDTFNTGSQTDQYGVATDQIVSVLRVPAASTANVSLLAMNGNNTTIEFAYMPIIYHGLV